MAKNYEPPIPKLGPYKPGYFLEISVENVRCFGQRQTLNLSTDEGKPSQWNIILGNNGTGKSTLLQCIAAMEPGTSYGLKKMHDIYPIGMSIMNDMNKDRIWKSNRKTGRLTSSIGGKYAYGPKLTDKNMPIAERFGSVEIKNGRLSSASISGNLGKGLFVCGYGATRRMSTSSIMDQRERLRTASIFWDDIDLLNAEEWLLQADYAALRAKDTKAAQQKFERIKSILVNLLPDVSEIEIIQPGVKRKTPEVRFITAYGKVELKSLGIGYQTMIAWMVDLASQLFYNFKESSDPLSESAVVLIDEIDLHLHPQWQRVIMNYLSEIFKNTQFIVTSHSPLVVQSAPSANIVVLKREGDHTIIDDSFRGLNKWRLDQLFASDLFGLKTLWHPNMERLILERRNLLSKKSISKRDKDRIEEIEQTMKTIPSSEDRENLEAMNLIRSAAKSLKNRSK